jgi:lipoate-protein ligase A
MKLICNKNITDPTVNLALEEYCVRNLDTENESYLLFYINQPSIIIGKHQNTIEEINQDYVNGNDIRVVRRISGGGAVYHDFGNLNFSFISKHSNDSIHNFRKFTQPVSEALKNIGVHAELSGRNDIIVEGRKISGNAQFTNTKSMFSHGTLLFDSHLDNVVEALNVKTDKIESKGIKSINIIVQEITDDEWKQVNKLSNGKYRTWEWNYGRSPEFNIQKVNRFGFGLIDTRIFVKDGMIEDIKFFGDYLGYGEPEDIEGMLRKRNYREADLKEILKDINLKYYFGDITYEEFVKYLCY